MKDDTSNASESKSAGSAATLSPILLRGPLKSVDTPKHLSISYAHASPSSPSLRSSLPEFFSPDLEPYLSCSMPGKHLRVAILLSGGVDSSVALRLLHAAGHSCTAFYLKIWFQVIPAELFLKLSSKFWIVPSRITEFRKFPVFGRAETQCALSDSFVRVGNINVVPGLVVTAGAVPLVGLITYSDNGVPDNPLFSFLDVVNTMNSLDSRTRDPLDLRSCSEDFENFWSACPWDEDLKYAQEVCDQAGAFMDAISSMEFDYVASGHYARVVHLYQPDGSSVLELSNDMVKDQTYFLSHLSQDQIRRLLFPLGCISKDEVRRLATKMNLPNKDRKDSQGICFLGKVKFSEFVARHIGETEGVLLEAETGDFLGKHRGFWFYTIGQRQGLRLPGGPWYVVQKDTKNNVVFVSRNYFSLDKRRRIFRVGSLKWLSGSPPNKLDQLRCKVRHGPGFYSCSMKMERDDNGQENITVVQLSEDDQGLAAGQYAAFYEGRTCIGSGVILDSWDDQSFPVCAKALEIATMEDKSKLGRPIKIKAKPEPSPQDTNCEGSVDLAGDPMQYQTTVPINETVNQRQAPEDRPCGVIINWLRSVKGKRVRALQITRPHLRNTSLKSTTCLTNGNDEECSQK
ncbi:hypothetical protein ACLOJK_016052 [Asimina triloba]